ncbi:MAG: acetate--CoA ligase family protein [Desulfobacteraceae bacterium]|nr:acetate--CoA ligase family protein [Desulfobacteraceae bacterium]
MKHEDDWKHELDAVFHPKSIAIVGASDAPGAWADIIHGNIVRGGWNGPVYPVHPKKEKVWGQHCFKSIEDIDAEVDLVVFLIAGRRIPEALEQCAAKKAKVAHVLSAGFAELTGEEGRVLQKELRAAAEKWKIRVIGPNCLGTISFYGGVSCFAGLLPDPMVSGPFGAVSQSGSFALGMLNATQRRGLGLSCLFSSGNEAVLEASDYIHYLVNDPGTKVIGAFIEGFKDPEKFLRVADLALEKEKPLVILKVGRSQKAMTACRSHTGSLVGADDVQDAIFKQKNVIRVESIDEMVDTARMLIHRKPLTNGSASFVGLSGGICAYISDNLERLGVPLPEFSEEGRKKLREILPDYAATNNPLDSTGQARIDLNISYRTIDTLVEEKTSDMFFYFLQSFDDFGTDMRKIAEYVAQEKAQTPDKFVGIHMLTVESWRPEVTEFYRKHPVPIIQGGFEPIRNYVQYLKRLAAVKAPDLSGAMSPECIGRVARCLGQSGGGTLCESVGHEVFSEYGIASPAGKTCASAGEALDFAGSVGFPVALKIDSAEISHKTDIGAVALNICDAAALKASYETIMANCRKACPSARDLKILVQKMAPDGIDVFVGMKMDEQFGPAIVLGMGGVLVEVLRDTSIRLAPVRRSEALEMIGELNGHKLFAGYRGKPAADVDALADTIVKVSRFAKQHQDRLLSLDINPVRVLEKGKGVLALDALIELR